MSETKTVWVSYTNTDCTEGRGYDQPIAVCATEATAVRLAKHQYVQGADGPVRQMDLVKIDGNWYAPIAAISVISPTKEDMATQKAIDAKRAAMKKAKAAGLTDSEVAHLGFLP